MTSYGDLTAVNIITGFLGSGKTTLLQRLLRSPQLSDVLVLVNEFGERSRRCSSVVLPLPRKPVMMLTAVRSP